MASVAVALPSVPASFVPLAPAIRDLTHLPERSKDMSKSEPNKKKRPCDACRRKKSKCEILEQQRNCTACTLHQRDCTFLEDPQSRKRKAATGLAVARPPERRSRTSSGAKVFVVSVETPKSSPTQMDESPSARQNHILTHARYVGPTTEADPELIALSIQHGFEISHNSYHKRGPAIFALDPASFQKSLTVRPAILENLDNVVGSYGPRLLELYRRNISPYLPVVEPEFFIDYHQGATMNLDPMLLAALFAVALPWLAQEEAALPPDLRTDKIEQLTFSLFLESLANPSLATLQAGMLLMQRPTIDTKTLNFQLVNAAFDLGLHLDCALWDSTGTEKALRRRLAWSLYIQDKWCSLIHGRPSLISNFNWAVADLSTDDFLVQTDTTPADSQEDGMLFRQLVQLTKILSTILDTFYSLKAMHEIEESGNNGTRVILERAKPVQISLKEWFGELPAALKMDSSNPDHSFAAGFLHLAYFATEITLHRCIIRSLQVSSNDEYLFFCRSAGKTRLISAMDFVNRLRTEHLNSFWYFPSQICFALIGSFGSLLLATAPGQEEVDFYKTRLGEFRWTLGVSSRTAPFLSYAVDNLDNFEPILRNLPERPHTIMDESQGSPRKRARNLSPPDEADPDQAHSSLFEQATPSTENQSQSIPSPMGLISPSTSVGTPSAYDAFA